MSSTTFQIYSA